MTLESAVEAILEQGKAEANRVLEEARNERQRMLSEVRAEAAKALAETEKAARIEAERKRVQELARAELESRKIVLAAQKEALDKVYDGALERLGRLSDNAEILRILKRRGVRGPPPALPLDPRTDSLRHRKLSVRHGPGPRETGRPDSPGDVLTNPPDGDPRDRPVPWGAGVQGRDARPRGPVFRRGPDRDGNVPKPHEDVQRHLQFLRGPTPSDRRPLSRSLRPPEHQDHRSLEDLRGIGRRSRGRPRACRQFPHRIPPAARRGAEPR